MSITMPLMIGWKGKNFSDRELSILQYAAIEALRERIGEEEQVAFDFEDAFGSLTCKGEGAIGTFAGIIFHANLPSKQGKKREAEFLVLRGAIDHEFPDGSYIQVSQRRRDGEFRDGRKIYRGAIRPRIIRRRSFN